MPASLQNGTPNADTLLSRNPNDTLAGGAGNDIYDVLHYGTRIVETDNGGADYVIARIDFTLPDFVEDLSMEYIDRDFIPQPATSGALVGIGNRLDNRISGNGLNNTIKGLGGNDTIAGQGGHDSIDGGDGNDELIGASGNDTLIGGAGNDYLAGGVGDDMIIGGTGDDRILGGDGLDVVRYEGRLGAGGDYTLVRGNDGALTLTASNGEGTDTLSGVEVITFGVSVWTSGIAAGQVQTGFDEALYLSRYGDVASAVRNGQLESGWQHFQLYGQKEGRSPNALFDTAYYLSEYKDVAAAVARSEVTAWGHFSQYGWKEGRDPSAWFNTKAYLAANEDVQAGGLNPLLHFLAVGAAEGRLAQIANSTLDWLG